MHPTIENAARRSRIKLADDALCSNRQLPRDAAEAILYKERSDGLANVLISTPYRRRSSAQAGGQASAGAWRASGVPGLALLARQGERVLTGGGLISRGDTTLALSMLV